MAQLPPLRVEIDAEQIRRVAEAFQWFAGRISAAADELHSAIDEVSTSADCLRCDPSASTMIVCSLCGNKRCPKATDHRLDCSGSNEPGQPGSAYPKEPNMSCRWCDRPIWLNEPSGEWFHESTAERACTEFVGSKVAAPDLSEHLGDRE